MVAQTLAMALRHRALVTGVLVVALLLNLVVVARLQPGNAFGDLPLAASCQGGGPGCAVQPLIPPPVGGLPHVDEPPAPTFGRAVMIEPAVPAPAPDAPPATLERPPRSTAA